jgi:anionic cell wall polymer biosynthesis LytR-Cps2A-Psr (LCP) family protein
MTEQPPGPELPEPDGLAVPLPAPDGVPIAAAPPDSTVPDVTTATGNPRPEPLVEGDVTSGDAGRAARRRAAEQAARSDADVSRRRVLIAGIAVVALLVALVGAWALMSRGDGESPGASPSVSPSATGPAQPTLLLSVSDKEGISVDSALTSIKGSVSLANMLTIAPDVLVDVPTGGTLPFGQVGRLPDANASATALSDAIGVNVDGTWALDSLALSGLVDSVGGIVLDVDVDVMSEQPDGTLLVLVPAGKHQLLGGPQAAAYATYLAPDEPEAARTVRFVDVFRVTLSKLPADAAKMASIISGLGASARSTVPTGELATYLVKLHEYMLADNVAYIALPTVANDAGGVAGGSRIDQDAAAAMVDKYFPDAKRKAGPNAKVRVLVQNGVGTPGLNTTARQRLVDAGYTFVNGGNAPRRGVAATQVIVADRTPENLALGADIAQALKVPATAVVVATDGQSIADVVVVLGADFTPDPA